MNLFCKSLITRYRLIIKPLPQFVDCAIKKVSEFLNIGDTFSQQKNGEVRQVMRESVDSMLQSDDPAEDASAKCWSRCYTRYGFEFKNKKLK